MLVPAKMQRVLIQEKRIMFNFKTHRNQAHPMCHISRLVGNPKPTWWIIRYFNPPKTVRNIYPDGTTYPYTWRPRIPYRTNGQDQKWWEMLDLCSRGWRSILRHGYRHRSAGQRRASFFFGERTWGEIPFIFSVRGGRETEMGGGSEVVVYRFFCSKSLKESGWVGTWPKYTQIQIVFTDTICKAKCELYAPAYTAALFSVVWRCCILPAHFAISYNLCSEIMCVWCCLKRPGEYVWFTFGYLGMRWYERMFSSIFHPGKKKHHFLQCLGRVCI